MKIILHRWLLLVSLSTTLAVNKLQLPPCPTSLQYFPQSLPMHCRMPRSADPGQFPDMPQYPTLPPLPESFYQSPSPDKQPPPVPIPIPPFPGMPGAMPMPGPMPGPMGGPMPGMPGPMPGMPGMPGPMPMPMPMVGGPAHKLPVIVMPFYSPDNSFKKQQQQDPHNHRGSKKRQPRKKKKRPSYDSDTDNSSGETASSGSNDSTDSSEHGFWSGRRKARRKMTRRFNRRRRMRRKETSNKNKNLLTPILQYVTKDGYVIYEKQISKSEAKDWLKPKSEVNVVEEKYEEKNNEFRQKSAEDFLKLDAEDIRMKAEERSKEAAAIEATTRKGKKHHPKKVNALMKFKPNSQS